MKFCPEIIWRLISILSCDLCHFLSCCLIDFWTVFVVQVLDSESSPSTPGSSQLHRHPARATVPALTFRDSAHYVLLLKWCISTFPSTCPSFFAFLAMATPLHYRQNHGNLHAQLPPVIALARISWTTSRKSRSSTGTWSLIVTTEPSLKQRPQRQERKSLEYGEKWRVACRILKTSSKEPLIQRSQVVVAEEVWYCSK